LRLVNVDDNTLTTGATAAANPVISADGKMVVFDTTASIDFNDADRNTVADVYRRDLENAMTQLVSPGDASRVAGAVKGAISSNGGVVAFESTDRSLYAETGTGQSEVFVRSFAGSARFTGLRRVSVTSTNTTATGAAQNAAISADGRVVAFESLATDMLGAGSSTAGRSHIYVRRADVAGSLVRADYQRTTAGTVLEANGNATLPALTRTGRMVTFTSTATNLDPLDANATADLYMTDVKPTLFESPPGQQDVKRQRAFLISASRGNAVSSAGIAAVPAAVSGDARYAVAISAATNLVAGTTGTNLYVLPLR
jgi:Tol biopolymer transport system component